MSDARTRRKAMIAGSTLSYYMYESGEDAQTFVDMTSFFIGGSAPGIKLTVTNPANSECAHLDMPDAILLANRILELASK